MRALRPDKGTFELLRPEGWVLLHLRVRELTRLLRDAPSVWRPERISDVEAAARLLSVHLAESVETQDPSPTGSWSYVGGLFWNLPPEDAIDQVR